jgi:hypothetical protein
MVEDGDIFIRIFDLMIITMMHFDFDVIRTFEMSQQRLFLQDGKITVS